VEAVPAVKGPRIRFAEELPTPPTDTAAKSDTKKKKTKKDERPEAEGKIAKKTPKRGKRLAVAEDEEDEDLELDWGGKDDDEDA